MKSLLILSHLRWPQRRSGEQLWFCFSLTHHLQSSQLENFSVFLSSTFTQLFAMFPLPSLHLKNKICLSMSHIYLGWAESGSVRKEEDLIQGSVCEVCLRLFSIQTLGFSQPLSFAGEILIKTVMDEPICVCVSSIHQQVQDGKSGWEV